MARGAPSVAGKEDPNEGSESHANFAIDRQFSIITGAKFAHAHPAVLNTASTSQVGVAPSAVAVVEAPPAWQPHFKSDRSNFGMFLEKLGRRRKRIFCTHVCKDRLKVGLLQLASPGDGHILYETLREMRWKPPGGVTPPSIFTSLVDVARTYDRTGDGRICVAELLEGALEVETPLFVRLRSAVQFVALLFWLSAAPVVYCTFADWSFLDAIYFAIMTLTTVGCGEASFRTDGLKVFTLVYTVAAICLSGWFIQSFLDKLLQCYEDRLRTLLRPVDDVHWLTMGHGGHDMHDSSRSFLEDLVVRKPDESFDGTSRLPLSEDLLNVKQVMPVGSLACRVLTALKDRAEAHILLFLALTFVGAGVRFWITIGSDGDSSFLYALYWSLAACTTIGAGEDMANREIGKALTVVFVLVAVPGCVFAGLNLLRIHIQQRAVNIDTELASRVLTLDVLHDMDTDGNGVDKLEFLCAALLVLNKVSARDICHALKAFRELDVDNAGRLHADKLSALRHRDCEDLEDPPLFQGSAQRYVVKPELHPSGESHEDHTCAHDGCSFSVALANRQVSEDSHIDEVREDTCTEPLSCVLQFESTIVRRSSESLEHATVPNRSAALTGLKDTTTEDISSNSFHPSQPPGKPSSQNVSADQDLLQDTLRLRAQLNEKDQDVVAAMQKQQQVEQALRQTLAERQALHGEVRLLKHKLSELEARASVEVRRREEAERRRGEAVEGCQEAQRRLREAESHMQEAVERHRRESERQREIADRYRQETEQLLSEGRKRGEEAERRAQQEEQRRADAEARAEQAAQRAQSAESSAMEATQRLRSAESEWHLRSEARASELQKKTVEAEMRRQQEVQSAMLEIQALTQNQHSLQAQVRRGQPPVLTSYVPSPSPVPKTRMKTGQQPWEVWEKASDWAKTTMAQRAQRPPTVLLTGRVKEQMELLDQQVRDLEARCGPELPRGSL